MKKKKTTKIVRLKSTDRTKLIDKTNILLVVPETFQASVRYGHKSGWCTATPSDNHQFKSHKRRGLLIYMLLFNSDENKRIGDAVTKLAFFRRYRKNSKWECYDFNDSQFDPASIFSISKEPIKEVIESEFDKRYTPRKVKEPSYKFEVNQIVSGVQNTESVSKVIFGKYLSKYRYVRRAGNWGRVKLDRGIQSMCVFDLPVKYIKRAVIINVTARTVNLLIKELDEQAHYLAKTVLANETLFVNVNLSMKENRLDIIDSNKIFNN